MYYTSVVQFIIFYYTFLKVCNDRQYVVIDFAKRLLRTTVADKKTRLHEAVKLFGMIESDSDKFIKSI